ncbi:WcaF family extracellular polysaccharide biosynthesis acetyltransferase [Brevundimonas nasdae]|uniref:WcaF family extracellular polysaccharide biosynthesis acetyltransferase n=1 Tax=Brevundimonas nasdae TaxID=172043 RepID=A0ABX8TF50_9CAUL|nr:WcaF family extracellular polysaccharide biosynthesis acetyltransferase [Brevundimonas nasdae]QYC09817.1 WcaF family extracellular polysaccharide biosynthesis acetyltransferase [Brevundimonas nasdae]QYC12606.1 WcaF family extracellular polysaccharide biosynthesis acetyltransferase [Brevundimonas nasdae]
MQDLSQFRTPPGFRGRSVLIVQLWWLVQSTLFACSPQFMFGWRNWLLRVFGASIGAGVLIRPSVRVTYPWNLTIGDHSWVGDYAELYTLGAIHIGKNAVVSQHCYLCTGSHDMTVPSFDIFAEMITVEDEAWIAAGAFVHPGVTIARGSVIAAKSVVRHSTEPFGVYAGSPLAWIRARVATVGLSDMTGDAQ